MKLALLVADRPADCVVNAYGDYVQMFTNLLTDASKSLAGRTGEVPMNLELTPFTLQSMELPTNIDDFDALLITGSKCSAYDTDEWIMRLKRFLVDTALNHPRVRMVGICFGHQVICEALGGKVTKNPKGWEVGWCEIELVQPEASKYLGIERTTMRIQQMHQDQVTVVPDGFIKFATTAHSDNQALLKPNHILTIQSHPEYPAGAVRELINLRTEKGIFTKEQQERWLSVVDCQTDGLWFAEKILEFIINH